MSDVVVIVSRSSHPDFEFFIDVRIGGRNGKQAKAFHPNSHAEVEQRLSEINQSFSKGNDMRIAAGKRPLSLSVIREDRN